jgi:hypothetical protein
LEISLNQILEKLRLELVLLLSVLAWLLLRFTRAIRKELNPNEQISVKILGHEVILIQRKEDDTPLTQQGKEKIEVTDG